MNMNKLIDVVYFAPATGEVAEWSKAHDWNSCKR